jgi:hypothetical protein
MKSFAALTLEVSNGSTWKISCMPGITIRIGGVLFLQGGFGMIRT